VLHTVAKVAVRRHCDLVPGVVQGCGCGSTRVSGDWDGCGSSGSSLDDCPGKYEGIPSRLFGIRIAMHLAFGARVQEVREARVPNHTQRHSTLYVIVSGPMPLVTCSHIIQEMGLLRH